jgi:N-acetylmuramoyl-L-alanine amidase
MEVKNANLKYKQDLLPLDLDAMKYIVLHHLEAKTAAPEDIHAWHLQFGWAGAGYNEYIRKDGTVYIMRGDNMGAHAQGYNGTGYGIACEGNYDTETDMPQAQFDALVERIKYHKSRLGNVQVVRHGDLNPTACPGKYFPFSRVIEALNTPQPEPQPHPFVVDLCGQGINMQFFPDHLEVRIGNGPWKVIAFDN